jgi:hypothetical protein
MFKGAKVGLIAPGALSDAPCLPLIDATDNCRDLAYSRRKYGPHKCVVERRSPDPARRKPNMAR